jgi:uncharacterized protein YdeI (YjbR/CyaY-like superfamily)
MWREVRIEYDPEPRSEPMNPVLAQALVRNKAAKAAFHALTPSRRKEILRYLNHLKSEAAVARTVEKVLRQLTG